MEIKRSASGLIIEAEAAAAPPLTIVGEGDSVSLRINCVEPNVKCHAELRLQARSSTQRTPSIEWTANLLLIRQLGIMFREH